MMPMTPRRIIEELHEKCGSVIEKTMEEEGESRISARFILIEELHSWDEVLKGRGELKLFEIAQSEYLSAILSVCHGTYRDAFKSLRLALELYLQGILLSVDEISLFEWINNHKDTSWSAVVDADRGVFSLKFVRAFFPELGDVCKNFETMSRTLYRELSECIHGNMQSLIIFPEKIEYSADALQTFLQKCDTLKLVLHFSLVLRYLKSVRRENFAAIEGVILEELGHIVPIRRHLGGTVG